MKLHEFNPIQPISLIRVFSVLKEQQKKQTEEQTRSNRRIVERIYSSAFNLSSQHILEDVSAPLQTVINEKIACLPGTGVEVMGKGEHPRG